MPLFEFNDSNFLGHVIDMEAYKIQINVESNKLGLARVGGIVAIKTSGDAHQKWLIALVDKITISVVEQLEITEPKYKYNMNEFLGTEYGMDTPQAEGRKKNISTKKNTVHILLIGTIKSSEDKKFNYFFRSVLTFPPMNSGCFALQGKNLELFMGLISENSQGKHALKIGHYTIDATATAYMDGNKLFQRHAALLGSTGSGKSWTVATFLEQAKTLPSANIIVFDMHGEYKHFKYAKQLRIAGPDDLNQPDPAILFLPYWLLNAEELQAMFIDKNEFSAPNQIMVFQDTITAAKKEHLTQAGKTEILNTLTIDSPVPFSLETVISQISALNEAMEQGSKGLKMGNFYGQFSRLLVRLRSKIADNRYGFLFQAPPPLHNYDGLHIIAKNLMEFSQQRKNHNQIKIIDFSEVPTEILPVIVGLVARLVYQVQFWMEETNRQPIAFICEEAHLYLPKQNEINSLAARALENFEKIAKEGRKYGVGLVVVSQRPADVNETILSQCNNFIVFRLTNYRDQEVIKKLLPEGMERLTEILPILEIGEALIVGDAVLLPTRVKIAEPIEKPSSATINFWDMWSDKEKNADIISACENMRKQRRK